MPDTIEPCLAVSASCCSAASARARGRPPQRRQARRPRRRPAQAHRYPDPRGVGARGRNRSAGVRSNLALMGLDTHDARGERIIIAERRSYVKPLLTPSGDRVVFSSRTPEGARIFVVNSDGTGLTPLGAGYALAAWRHPSEGSESVSTTVDTEKLPGPPNVSRFGSTGLTSGRSSGARRPWPSIPFRCRRMAVAPRGSSRGPTRASLELRMARCASSVKAAGRRLPTRAGRCSGLRRLAPQRDHGGFSRPIDGGTSASIGRPDSTGRRSSIHDGPTTRDSWRSPVRKSGRRQSGPQRRRSG